MWKNTSSDLAALGHLPLKGKAKIRLPLFPKAFPFRGRWHDEVVTDEVVISINNNLS